MRDAVILAAIVAAMLGWLSQPAKLTPNERVQQGFDLLTKPTRVVNGVDV